MAHTDTRLSLLYDVHRVSSLSHELVERSLEGHEMSGTEFALYSYLVTQGPVTVSAVAAGIAAPIATASKLLGRIEERGHLVRSDNPADGRSTFVDLSDSGRAAHADARPGFRAALERVKDELGGTIDDVRWALARLDNALAASLDQPETTMPERPQSRRLDYDDPPLTATEEADARRYIDWLRWQRQ